MQPNSSPGHYGNSNLRRSFGHFVLGKSIGAVIGVFWLLTLVRALPAGDYGIYVGFVAYLELFNLLSNFGLSPISERFVPEYRQKDDEPHLRALIIKLVGFRILVVCVLSAITATLAHALTPLLGFESVPAAFVIFHVVVAVESIARYVETIFDSLLQQGRSQISLFSRTGIRLVLLLTAISFGQVLSLEHLVALEATAYLCGLVITFALLCRTLKALHRTSDASVALKPLIGFAAPIYGSQVVGSLIGVDVVKLLVLKTTGAEASAIFGFCASLAWMLQRYLPSFLLVGMVRPLIVSAATDPAGGSRLQRMVSVILKLNAMLIGCALAISLAVGDQLVVLLSGGKFSTGGGYLSLFLLFTLSQTLRATYGHVALARGQGRAMLLGQLSGAFILTISVAGSWAIGPYAYCVALVAIDLVWFAWVQNALMRRGQVPDIPWTGLGKIALMTTTGWLIGTGLEYVFPEQWPIWQKVAVVCVAVAFLFIALSAVLPPFTQDERLGFLRLLPNRLREFMTFQTFHISKTLKRTLGIQKLRAVIEGKYRLALLQRHSKYQSPSSPKTRVTHLVLLPTHPENPFGSRGDQAMTFAAISEFRSMHPNGKVSVVTSAGHEAKVFGIENVHSIPIWGRHNTARSDLELIGTATYFAAIGADVMDGYYWPLTVLRALDMCEQARLRGAAVGLLGFSFNSKPNPFCIRAFQLLNPAIRLFCRDPVSHARFVKMTGRDLSLVADTAFCLQPRKTPAVFAVDDWCNVERSSGRVIVGFNLHLMLLDVAGACSEDVAVTVAAQAISKLVEEFNVSVVLIPHDFRGEKNDKTMLEKCLSLVTAKCRAHVFLPDTEFLADELKAIAGLCSLVITGRMHLAIATLGVGVPVAAVAYQDKFEGLFEHFNLSRSLIIQPTKLGEVEAVWAWMKAAFEDRTTLAQQVQERLPGVMRLSRKNFDWMSPHKAHYPAKNSR